MGDHDDESQPGFWSALYKAGEAGWDKGTVAPPIARLVDEAVVPAAARVIVLGAGFGHEAIYVARSGRSTVAVDFAPEAADALRVAAHGVPQLEVMQADLFALPGRGVGGFAGVLEHTCFCAIEPARRAEYVDVAHALLAPGGALFGLFYAHGRAGGPPHSTSEAEVRQLFERRFTFERLRQPDDSFENRRGAELEFIARRR